jgi:hypothetical protein
MIVKREPMGMYRVCSRILDYMWKDEMEHYLENIERYTEHLSNREVEILNDKLMDFHPYKSSKRISNQIIQMMFNSDKTKVGEHIFHDVFILGSCIREYAEDPTTDVNILSKTTASEVLEEINKEVDMSKVLEAFETPVNEEPKKYDVKHFTQLNKIIGGEE